MRAKQNLRVGPGADQERNTVNDYEDMFEFQGGGNNSKIIITSGIAYIGMTKVHFPKTDITLVGVANGDYDLCLDQLGNLSFEAVGGEGANQISLYRVEITNERVTARQDLRHGQSKGGSGAGGVNTQEDGVAVASPATTIDWQEGIIASGGATTDINCDWAEVGDLAEVGAANAAGVSVEVARADHVHEGVHSIDGTGGALTGDVTLSEGANITLTQAGQDIEIASSGGAGGVDTEEDGVAVNSPATTINWQEGIIASGLLGTTNINCDWAAVATLSAVGAANAAGASTEVARADHVHEGVHSIDGTGGALTGDVTLSEGANVTLTQVGQDIEVASSGGGGGFVDENFKARDYHDVVVMDEYPMGGGDDFTDENGNAGERCIAHCDDGRVLYLKRKIDGVGISSLILTVEYHDETAGNNGQKMTYNIQITNITEVTNGEPGEGLVPEAGGMALTVEQAGESEETFHIVFAAVGSTGFQEIYDCYDLTSNLPNLMMGSVTQGGPNTYSGQAELVSRAGGDLTASAKLPAVAADISLNAGPGVVVDWIRASSGPAAPAVYSNYYDPAQPIGSRYDTTITPYTVQTITRAGLLGSYACTACTVEVGTNQIHHIYNCPDSGGLTHPQYTWEPVSGIMGVTTGAANLDAAVANQIDTANTAPSAVVLQNNTDSIDECLATFMHNDGDNYYLVMYRFDSSGGVINNTMDKIIDTFRSGVLENFSTGHFQMSVSDVDFEVIDQNIVGPQIFVYKATSTPTNYGSDFVLLYQKLSNFGDAARPFATVPLHVGNDWIPSDNASYEYDAFNPKVVFNNNYPVRPYKVDGVPWYPANCWFRTDWIRGSDGATMETMRVMIAKDIPSFVLEED